MDRNSRVVVLACMRNRLFHDVHNFLITSGREERASKQVVTTIYIRIPADSSADLFRALVVTTLGKEHPGFRKLNLRCVVTFRACLLRCGNSAIKPLLLPLEVVVILRADVCEAGMR